MNFPPANSFFYYLAADETYNSFKDIYSVETKKDRNILETEKKIFSKFSDVTNVNQFEDVFEREFNDQRETILLQFGPNSKNPRFKTRDELYSTLWERLDKFLEEKGEKRTRVGSFEEIIDNFIENSQEKKNQDAFFGFIKRRIENSPSDENKITDELKREIKNLEKSNILREIMIRDFSSDKKPDIEEFKSNPYKYFNYGALILLINNVQRGSKNKLQKLGWKYETSPSKYIQLTKIIDVSKLKETNETITRGKDKPPNLVREEIKAVKEAALKVATIKRKTGQVKGEEFASRPKMVNTVKIDGKETKISIDIQAKIDKSPLYELFVSRDNTYKSEKFDLILDEMEGNVEINSSADDEKIRNYLQVLDIRDGPSHKLILFDLDKARSKGNFFRDDGSYVKPHPMLEEILLGDVSKAIEGATKQISMNSYLEKERVKHNDKSTEITRKDIKDMLKNPTKQSTAVKGWLRTYKEIEENGKSYDGETLIKLFNLVRSGRVSGKNIQKYGDYLVKDGDKYEISLDNDMFTGDMAEADKKLVKIVKEGDSDIYITTNVELRRQLNKDLDKIISKADSLDGHELVMGSSKIISSKNVEKLGLENDEVLGDEIETKKIISNFDKPEEEALYQMLINTVSKNNKIKEANKKLEEGEQVNLEVVLDEDIKFSKLSPKDAFQYAFHLAKQFIGGRKQYDSKIEKIEESAEKDLSMENEDLVNSIKDLAGEIVEALKPLKAMFVKGLNQKLQDIVDKKGKNKALFNTKSGKAMKELLITNNLLNRV